MISIGIDPGKTGAIAVIANGKLKQCIATPWIEKEIDYHAYNNIAYELEKQWDSPETMVFLEKVNALFGASAGTTFKFGMAFGAAKMIASGMRNQMVTPGQWQKVAWQGVTKVTKTVKGKQKTDTKAMSLIAAKRLFPEWDFRNIGVKGTPLTTYHDGKIDAALIAWYGYKEMIGS